MRAAARSLLVVGASLLALACAEPDPTLIIQVRTDLSPGVEFIEAHVARDGGDDVVVTAEEGDAWAPGVRVHEEVLPPASYHFTVTLADEDGDVVSRPVRVVLERGINVVTVLLTRDCAGVLCDDPGAPACLAGRCVPDDCSEEHPELCPDPDCTSADDCVGTTACAALECTASGACFESPDDELCPAGERCDLSARMCVDPVSTVGPEWAVLVQGDDAESVRSVAVLPDGSIVALGNFGDADVDIHPSRTLSASSVLPSFVAAYDKEGLVLWDAVADTDGSFLLGALDVSESEVLVAGSLVGSGLLGSARVSGPPGANSFIGSLKADGDALWGLSFPGSGMATAIGAAPDAFFLGGVYTAAFDFGASNLSTPRGAGTDLFLGTLARDGTPLSALAFTGDGDEMLEDVATDGVHLCVVGTASAPIDLGAGSSPNGGGDDAWVAHYYEGAYTGERQIRSPGNDQANATAVGPGGDCIVVGAFDGVADIGRGPEPTLGASDAFVMRVGPVGEVRWVRTFAGTRVDRAEAVAVDALGRVYVAGTFSGTASIDEGEPMTSVGATAAFVLGLDPEGALLFQRQLDSDGFVDAASVGVAPDGSLVAVGGTFEGMWDSLGTMGAHRGVRGDGFVARINPR